MSECNCESGSPVAVASGSPNHGGAQSPHRGARTSSGAPSIQGVKLERRHIRHHWPHKMEVHEAQTSGGPAS